MSKWNWDTDRNEESNVSVNDGVVTYYAEWDTDENGAIDLRQVFNAFAATYDHNGEGGVVEVEVENLITGETLTDEIECDLDEDADDDDEDEEARDILFVVIEDKVYEIDTDEGMSAANTAALEAGIVELPVYSGSGKDGDDSIQTSMVFIAREEV